MATGKTIALTVWTFVRKVMSLLFNTLSRFVVIYLKCLFNLYADYITRNAGLEEVQAGIRIVGKNINNLRYANDTTLMVSNRKQTVTKEPLDEGERRE